MNFSRLRDFTPARVSLGRSGNSLPTAELLQLQLAHARARESVASQLDLPSLTLELHPLGCELLFATSAALDRATYLRRPDLGRRLSPISHDQLVAQHATYDAAFILADGLSARAVQVHAAPLLQACFPALRHTQWNLAPLVIVQQGRVAIGDEVGHLLGAALSIVLIGERPGLSSADSLGLYLTWNPVPGLTDAHRNCISNIRAEGLSYPAAAHKLLFLMTEARRLRLSGVALKEDAGALLTAYADMANSSNV